MMEMHILKINVGRVKISCRLLQKKEKVYNNILLELTSRL